MGSRKLPKIVRGMGAPEALPASMAIVTRAGMGLTTVICARQEHTMSEAKAMGSVLRRDDIRRSRENDVRLTRRRQSHPSAAELQRGVVSLCRNDRRSFPRCSGIEERAADCPGLSEMTRVRDTALSRTMVKTEMAEHSEIRAPRGNTKTARGWIQEAAKRMLMNNLDPEVAEKPEELIVYGGRGKAARNWDAYHTLVSTLDRLENNQTLLVQSGKAVAVLETQALAPRVLIANSNLVPHWATWDEFDRLDRAGLMMYGQMTAGSWIYIGTQGILQGTYETFLGAAQKYFNGSLKGTITLTAGLGGMGGAQPLAVKLAGGVSICVEVDESRIQRRIATRYLDEVASSLGDAISRATAARKEGRAVSIGLLGNAEAIL